MTRLVTLPKCRHNIVINTLFLKPEVMSGFNSLWLFSFFRPLGGNMYRLTSVKVAQVKISQTKNSGQKFRPKIQARNSGQKMARGIWKRHDTDFDYIFDADGPCCCRSCCIVKLADPRPNSCC